MTSTVTIGQIRQAGELVISALQTIFTQATLGPRPQGNAIYIPNDNGTRLVVSVNIDNNNPDFRIIEGVNNPTAGSLSYSQGQVTQFRISPSSSNEDFITILQDFVTAVANKTGTAFSTIHEAMDTVVSRREQMAQMAARWAEAQRLVAG